MQFRAKSLRRSPSTFRPSCRSLTISAYTSAWNTADAKKRAGLLETAWADGGRYVDPQSDVTGRDQLDQHIGDFLKNTPGASLDGTSKVFESSSAVGS